MLNPSRAELLPAFIWTCPSCGRDSFERTIVAELSAEEMQELREEYAVEVWQNGHFLRAPTSVKCPHCLESFETEEM